MKLRVAVIDYGYRIDVVPFRCKEEAVLTLGLEYNLSSKEIEVLYERNRVFINRPRRHFGAECIFVKRAASLFV